MSAAEDKIPCHTPTPGKRPVRIDAWKYRAVRRAILRAVPKRKEGVEFRALPGLVKMLLPEGARKSLGSVSWYTTVVKLDMEVKGEIVRIPRSKPQRLWRSREE